MRKQDDPATLAMLQRLRDNLRHHVAMSGLSHEDLAFRAEVHRTLISALTRPGGERRPGAAPNPPKDICVTTLVKLAGALELEPAQLLAGMSWQPGHFSPGQFKTELRQVAALIAAEQA